MNPILEKYAKLLINYSLELKEGEKLFINSSYLAEPLLQEVYKEALKVGAFPSVSASIDGLERIEIDQANDQQLAYISPTKKHHFEKFDAYLNIVAPFNLTNMQMVDKAKLKKKQEATKVINQIYHKRTGDGSLKRSLCLFPTLANAQNAGLSLHEYEKFVYNACYLFENDPVSKWLEVRAFQQKIVDVLNNKELIRYKGNDIDISFSTKGRLWINSDGRNNMPSGEVFTSPVEDSVNGKIRFTYPAIFMGREVEDVTLVVEKGEVVKWDAKRGKDLLDDVFSIEGARRFGEAAIGTNTNIDKFTKNILFDEKLGGTVHMAIGQSYLNTGGKNQSAIHWDLLADMKDGGEIYADDELIYREGKFLF